MDHLITVSGLRGSFRIEGHAGLRGSSQSSQGKMLISISNYFYLFLNVQLFFRLTSNARLKETDKKWAHQGKRYESRVARASHSSFFVVQRTLFDIFHGLLLRWLAPRFHESKVFLATDLSKIFDPRNIIAPFIRFLMVKEIKKCRNNEIIFITE